MIWKKKENLSDMKRNIILLYHMPKLSQHIEDTIADSNNVMSHMSTR